MNPKLVSYLRGALIALLGVGVALLVHLPLPWMLGALLATAAARIAGWPAGIGCPSRTRNVGQWVIGASLGLYFTPAVFQLIGENLGLIVAGMGFSLLLAVLGTVIYCHLGRLDFRTAWFSSAIGGAAEMSVLAERNGARVDFVVTSHSVRLLLVVSMVPLLFQWLDIHGQDPSAQLVRDFNGWGFVNLVVLTALAGFLFDRLNISNAWVLGPLCAVILVSRLELPLSAMPEMVSRAGQFMIGWSLGNKYRREFFQVAPRFLLSVVLFSVLSVALAFLFGLLAARVSVIPAPTLILGTTPGGIAEMAITAKVLQLGVPVVTAFHTTRMIFVVLVTGPLYHWLCRRYPL
ncbi:MAG: AbrB family transcriptional regulator [Lautropia sp.]|nr:AbrB family transcriptional regulator [Lautropia sp.]